MNKNFFKKGNAKNMKNKNIKIFFLILILLLFIATIFVIINNYLINNSAIQKNDLEKIDTREDTHINNENILEQVETINVTETKNEKQKIDLGIYLEKNGIKTLITSHTCSWEPENVMGVFYAVPYKETTLPLSPSFNTLWKEYISTYENYSSIKVGYNISFTLNNGETIDRTILNPDDAYYMFPKVMVFLYDDVNLIPGKRYYHITQNDMDEDTICSSIKLVGDVETKNISSDITLTAFCYTSEDDFNKETGKYIRRFLLQYNYL